MQYLIIIIIISLLNLFSCSDSIPLKQAFTTNTDINQTADWYTKQTKLNKNLLKKNYYVVLDGSGSMDSSQCSGLKTKAIVAKEALTSFANVLSASSNLGLLVFDSEGIMERVPLGINNRLKFIEEVNKAGANGGTPLKTSIKLALAALKIQGGKQLGYGEYHLVVVTDGEAMFNENPQAVVQEIIKTTPIIVHTLGFCIGENHSLNQPGFTIYKTAKNAEDLVKGLQDVLAESKDFVINDFGDDK